MEKNKNCLNRQYIDVLKQIIKQNSLTDFDDVNVMPTSNKTKKLI